MSEPASASGLPPPLLDDECRPQLCFLEQRFPHILQRISVLWGKPQLDDYLHALLGAIRPGASGFPKEALAEIVEIKRYCRSRGFSGGREPNNSPAIREAFFAWLNYDQHAYPYALEAEFPQLLEEMLPLLDTPALGEHIDRLLSPAKQMHHSFSEAALIELMTIKAVRHARLAEGKQKSPSGSDDQSAALVLDRHHRR